MFVAPSTMLAQAATTVAVAAPVTVTADSLRPRDARPTTPAAPKAAPRPDFRNLRFDEQWSRVPGSTRWDDRIKAIPLGGKATISFGGQVRAREEFARSFNLTSASDDYGQSRTLLNVDLGAGTARGVHARVFGEFRDAQSYSRELPGGTRPQDGDRSDIQNLFAEAGFGRSFVRVGRQEVVSGRERLIGVPDWSNTRRGFQGQRAVLVRGRLMFDVLDARPVVVRQSDPNVADSSTRFIALTLGSAPGAKPLARGLPATWQTYWYQQRIVAASPTRRITAGGRAAWTRSGKEKTSQSYGLESEAAVQRGSAGARAIQAWFWTVELQTQWRSVRGAPTIAFGVEEASGDRDATDGRVEGFNALYAAAHAHGGYADVFGRGNARQVQVISTWEPVKPVNLRASWHHYARLRLQDGIYNKQNTVMRAASGSTERHAGDEFNLTGAWSVTRHLKVIFGHAWVEPGAFLRQTPGGASAERWGFAGSAFTF